MRVLSILTFFSLLLFADSGYYKRGVAPVSNELYKNECGACHFDYQAGLLPESSWKKIMANLENHFNTDATLEKEDFKTIMEYLKNNSAEKHMEYKRSNRIVKSIKKGTIPKSISKTPYMIRKHREIRTNLITQEEVKGLFNCTACHTTAQKGIYSERDIKIPNYGRWYD